MLYVLKRTIRKELQYHLYHMHLFYIITRHKANVLMLLNLIILVFSLNYFYVLNNYVILTYLHGQVVCEYIILNVKNYLTLDIGLLMCFFI